MTTRHTDSSQYRSAKLALRDRIDCDTRLSPWTRLVGGQIIKRSWEDVGCTDAEAYFGKVLGASPATVKSAIKALREKGYIRVEKRGRSNQYFLIFEQGQNLALSQEVASKASATSRGQGGTGPIGLKNDADRAEKQPPTGSKNDPLIPLEPLSIIPLSSDGDLDGEGLPPAENEIQIKAKSLAMQVAAIAGLEQKPWPLHWQNAPTVVARWWDQGWTNEEILTGARLTMQNKEKQSSGPPASIEYFEREIGRLVAKRGQTLSAREQQAALRAIAGKIGWHVIVELSEERQNDLCERWSRDSITDEELCALKTEVEAALKSSSRRAAAG